MKTPEELFDEYMPFANQLANRYAHANSVDSKRFLPGQLKQAALIGLWTASRKYRDDLKTTFRTYAAYRIYGSMKDEMRAQKWFFQRTGQQDLMSVVDFDLKSDTAGSMTNRRGGFDHHGWIATFDRDEGSIIDLSEAIYALDERDRSFVEQRWFEEQSLKTIGKHFGVSESRACLWSEEIRIRLERMLSRGCSA